ncbi:Holliday junction DNA helicase subunit RuvA [Humitalea rosea]|uniref:Holliday junction branch migration complex subunit RuvA n=1 Tax=Humitalea rosea TaxID=990373 RepID=A0A2W7IDS4_9PROT|nr:Holliday junction branch migration protein RuvA [Humitalea rosea]PZW43195.1 Holliday junction DNA helicase subunit RuvA [Humitalea rosea]
MIAMLTGRVAAFEDGACVLDVNGVGYLVSCSARTLDFCRAAPGILTLLVETQVRQDAIVLHGFADAAEREAFRALIEVKTVGPQKAMVVLSGLAAPDLAQAIAFKDRKRLAGIKGLGVATANRIVDEPAMQKWAVGRATPSAEGPALPAASLPPSSIEAEAVSALVNLGFRRPEAMTAVGDAARRMGDDLVLAALITDALRTLAPR